MRRNVLVTVLFSYEPWSTAYDKKTHLHPLTKHKESFGDDVTI